MTSIVSSSINNILSNKNRAKLFTSAINNASAQALSLQSYIQPSTSGFSQLLKPIKIKNRHLFYDENHEHLVFNSCMCSDENNIILDLNYLNKCKEKGELNIKDPTLSGNIYVDGIIKHACFNKGKFYNSTFNNITFEKNSYISFCDNAKGNDLSFECNPIQKTYSINCLKKIISCADTNYKKSHVANSIHHKYSDISFPNGLNLGNKWRLIIDKNDKDLLILQYFDKSGIWLTKTTFCPE